MNSLLKGYGYGMGMVLCFFGGVPLLRDFFLRSRHGIIAFDFVSFPNATVQVCFPSDADRVEERWLSDLDLQDGSRGLDEHQPPQDWSGKGQGSR